MSNPGLPLPWLLTLDNWDLLDMIINQVNERSEQIQRKLK